jgi:hypothetical protein
MRWPSSLRRVIQCAGACTGRGGGRIERKQRCPTTAARCCDDLRLPVMRRPNGSVRPSAAVTNMGESVWGRALPGCELGRMTGFEREAHATVVQEDAGGPGHQV